MNCNARLTSNMATMQRIERHLWEEKHSVASPCHRELRTFFGGHDMNYITLLLRNKSVVHPMSNIMTSWHHNIFGILRFSAQILKLRCPPAYLRLNSSSPLLQKNSKLVWSRGVSLLSPSAPESLSNSSQDSHRSKRWSQVKMIIREFVGE